MQGAIQKDVRAPGPWRRTSLGADRAALQRLVREHPMLDLVFVGATIAFFVAAFAYVRACDRV
jgi:hypothetical protein